MVWLESFIHGYVERLYVWNEHFKLIDNYSTMRKKKFENSQRNMKRERSEFR